VNLAKLSISPAIFASPDDANGDGFFTYPQGTHSQTTWGGGFVLGAYYQEETWAVGASVKSPQWFDTFRFNSNDEIGRPRTLNFNLDLPLIASLGASYRGFERWMLAADVRYLDYNDANGLGDAGFLRTGAVNGVGWKSIFAAAAGAQYDLTDAVSLRLGYSWNGNPVPNGLSAINAATPVIIEHMLSAGASWRITQDFTLSLAYVHGFQNSGEGPLLTPAGAVPGTSVKNATSGDIVVLGGSVTFGGSERHKSSIVHPDP
jgi:long-chain fatty acid transport protein